MSTGLYSIAARAGMTSTTTFQSKTASLHTVAPVAPAPALTAAPAPTRTIAPPGPAPVAPSTVKSVPDRILSTSTLTAPSSVISPSGSPVAVPDPTPSSATPVASAGAPAPVRLYAPSKTGPMETRQEARAEGAPIPPTSERILTTSPVSTVLPQQSARYMPYAAAAVGFVAGVALLHFLR